MRVNIAAYTIQDWQGPTSNIKFRVVANESFVARNDDGTGFSVDAAPSIFREVDCTVSSTVIDGLTVKTITIPAMWLYSTTDGIVNRQSSYNCSFVQNGRSVNAPVLMQGIQLSAEILSLGNPTNWTEIIRFNNPAAPVPIDRETYSKTEILELISQYSSAAGASHAQGRIAYWGLDTTIEGATTFSWDEPSKRVTLSDGQFRAIQVGAQTPVHIRAAAAGSTRIFQVTDSVDAELFGVSRTTAGFAAAITTTFSGPSIFSGLATFNSTIDINTPLTLDAGVTFNTTPITFNIDSDFNNPITVDGGATFTTTPVVFNVGVDFNSAITVDAGSTFTQPVVFNTSVDFNNAFTVDAVGTFSVAPIFNAGFDVNAASTFDALTTFRANVQFGANGVGTSVVILDDNAVGTSDIRSIDNTQGVRFFATDVFGNNDGGKLSLYGNAHANTGQVFLDSGGHASAFISFRTSTTGAPVERLGVSSRGEIDFQPGARSTGGTTRYFRTRTPADTTLTADTESIGIQIGGDGSGNSVTRQFTAGGGGFTTQREVVFVHPTYAASSSETITNSATVTITNAPQPGSNMTLTNPFALWIQAGKSQLEGVVTIVPAARTSGPSLRLLQVITPADTGLTASTESILNQFGGNTSSPPTTVTRQFATGAITTQRENVFVAPTYGFVGSSTITNTATVSITNAPQLGTNATFTNAFALWVEAGNSRFDSNVIINNNAYLGNGITNASPNTGFLNATGGLGSNIAGANLILAPGKGTGNAVPGLVGIQYPLTTTSGSTLQALSSNVFPIDTLMFLHYNGDVTVNTTTAETSILGSADIGTATIEAGLARVGRCFNITAYGIINNNASTPTFRVRLKFGSTTIGDTGAVTMIAIGGGGVTFKYEGLAVVTAVGASGSITVYQNTFQYGTANSNSEVSQATSKTTTTIDFTASQAWDLTIQWGTSSATNSITRTLTRITMSI